MLKLSSLGILAALLLTAGACKKSESVPIGGECSTLADCVGRADCVKVSSGKSLCTKSCEMPVVMGPPGTPPTPDTCPAPTTCQLVNMDVTVRGDKSDVGKVPRCLPAGAL